ncbi:Cation/H(+) antiporter 15 [Acorus gramineus]|uniref:Cation/H(+) antiporter 15 n=1 Tax=Acorus gramineus TaxID=55184 RepID=A0AAV9B6X0_ACOGR|nr:Cation/H(+) antiporter 15 [Acorus gramineus]
MMEGVNGTPPVAPPNPFTNNGRVEWDSIICHPLFTRVTSGGLFHGVDPLQFSLPLLLFQISVMFVVSNAVHFLLRPLKQPRILSNIIGGIILGPSGFGRNKAFADKMYPPRSLMTLETASIFGMMYSVFLVGLKMDPTIIIRAGRRSIIIATCSILASFSAVCLAAHLLASSLPHAIVGTPLLVFVSAVLSITCFPNLAHTLTELDLLNTELGRLSMSVSMIHDAIGWCLMALFITLRAGYNDAPRALYALSSLAALAFFVVFVYRPWVRLVVRRTPKGEMCVKEGQVMGILLSVGVVGFLVNAVGGTAMDGALFLGLTTPEGSTLSAAMTEKTEGVVAATLIPLLFLWSGIITDVRLARDQEGVALIAVIVLVGCMAKIAGTVIPSLYFRMPLRNAVMLALIMNIKGLIEILIFLQWRNTGLMDDASYTMIVLSITVVLAVIAPLVSMSYKPQRQKLSLNARTIQHSPPHSELCVLACIHNEDCVPSILNLIESTHATPQTPLRVVVLRLVELAGLASSALIPHKNHYGHLIHRDHHHPDHVVNAFACYERSKPSGEVWVDPFTAVSPVKSMHQDVCALAQEKLAALIVVPFHDKAARATARGVLDGTPCSVGLLVDRGMYSVAGSVGRCPQRIGALFFGGRDDREALAYARRLAGHPYATLVVARFLPKWDARAEERMRDEEAVEEIRYLMIHNGRVAYEEFEVDGVEEMMEVVRGMEGRYDLVMVGRRSGAGSRLTDGLTEWSEWPELGVVGDVLASSDFGDSTSVLICLMFVSSRTVRFLLKPLKQSRLVSCHRRHHGHQANRSIRPQEPPHLLHQRPPPLHRHHVRAPPPLPLPHRALAHPSFFVFVAITISLTLFPNVIHILSELKLLNTELGQLSASCAMLNVSVGWLFIVLFIFHSERAVNPVQSIKAMACVIVIIAFITYVYHPWATRVTRRTPNGGRVRDGYVFAIILFVPLVALCFDAVGGSMADGALFLGLATPDGPPLGSAIVEKMEAIVGEVLMPLMMLWCGLKFDLFQSPGLEDVWDCDGLAFHCLYREAGGHSPALPVLQDVLQKFSGFLPGHGVQGHDRVVLLHVLAE